VAKNNITAQDGTEQYQVKGVKPENLSKKSSYELNTGNETEETQKTDPK
jgi:hypothetical protein